MNRAPDAPSSSDLANRVTHHLVWINAAAAAMLLAALLVAGIWQDAATDFVPYIALALAFHGAGLLWSASVYALRWLRARSESVRAARAFGYLTIIACAACALCFAAGLSTIAWGGLNAISSGSGYDTESRSVPL
ncbi:MAG TPA: hypothetical protein VFE23_13770 [Usitatibacter sp.]|nr:hypothetical protein [Usitatibacter sp.]